MWGLPSSALQGLSLSRVMVTYVVLQFLLWAVHDGLQQLMFEQPGFAPFGTTMALFLQTTCVVGSLLEGALSRLVPAPDPPKPANKPRSSEAAPPGALEGAPSALLWVVCTHTRLGRFVNTATSRQPLIATSCHAGTGGPPRHRFVCIPPL